MKAFQMPIRRPANSVINMKKFFYHLTIATFLPLAACEDPEEYAHLADEAALDAYDDEIENNENAEADEVTDEETPAGVSEFAAAPEVAGTWGQITLGCRNSEVTKAWCDGYHDGVIGCKSKITGTYRVYWDVSCKYCRDAGNYLRCWNVFG